MRLTTAGLCVADKKALGGAGEWSSVTCWVLGGVRLQPGPALPGSWGSAEHVGAA